MDADSGKIVIRRAATADAAVLAQMGKETFARSYQSTLGPEDLADYTSGAFGIDRISAELNDPAIIYFVAAAETKLCAYAKLEPTPLPKGIDIPKPIELARLYAATGWTGKGVGTKLTEASIKAVAQAGYQSVWLRVWEKNDRAIKFYHRWGFSKAGTEPYFVGKTSEPVAIMIRPIANSKLRM